MIHITLFFTVRFLPSEALHPLIGKAVSKAFRLKRRYLKTAGIPLESWIYEMSLEARFRNDDQTDTAALASPARRNLAPHGVLDRGWIGSFRSSQSGAAEFARADRYGVESDSGRSGDTPDRQPGAGALRSVGEVAALVAFVAGSERSYMTGANLTVDGVTNQ